MKKYEYMVTSIVIKKADEMIKVLSDKFNQYGIYIKRDYEKYYDTQEVDKIYELAKSR